jgi:hypothetical protein
MFIIFLTFFLFSCNKTNGSNIHPFNDIENYNGSITFPINQRMLNTPSLIIDILNEFDNVDFYSSYTLAEDEKQLFINYFELLPVEFKNIITEKVTGIYFINNFLGGGMTLPVFDNNANMYMVLFFNPEILKQNISEWINFRDNSAFINNGSNINIVVECNSHYKALIHTLFHEAGHVYDYYHFITPYTEKFLKNDQTKFPTEFIENIWNDYDETIEKYNYRNRQNVSFYDLGERLDIRNSIAIYTSLQNTPFVSLYGGKNWAEDFAESFTWYYLNKYYGIEYKTTIKRNGNALINFDPNNNESVKSRYEIFGKIE